MVELIYLQGFNIRIVSGDGNCLFRAISDQVYGTDKHYPILRRYCMDYLEIKKISLTPIRLSYHKKNHYNSIIPLKKDFSNFRRYKDALIKTKPGIFESKIIAQAKKEEAQVDKTIKLSEDEYNLRLKKNLSNKIEDLSNSINEKEKKEEYIENKEKEKKEEKEDKNKEKEELKNKNKDKEELKNEEKDKDKENNILEKNIFKLNKIDSFSNNYGSYLNDPRVQFALDSGFDLNDIINALEMNNGDIELAMDNLLNHQDKDYQ